MPRWGQSLRVGIRSTESVQITEPTLGLSADQPNVDAPLGSTPDSRNFIMRDGALEPRPMLSLRNSTPQPFGADPILGGMELVSVANSRYPIVSGTTRWAVYGQSSTPNGWSVLSYVSAAGLNTPPALATTDYWDFAQIYDATADEMIAVGAPGSYQSLYCTASNTTVFSTLTGAPRARTVATFDNFVLAANIKADAVDLVQRVQWSDRGDPRNWTAGLSGFEDLLAMRGQITRLVSQENKVYVFSEVEIWQGTRGDDVFLWSFTPYDRAVGCPYPWTIAETPLGLMFLGKDYDVYLLPKVGGPAQPIGQRLHRSIRQAIDHPERAWAVYDRSYSQYQLYYPVRGGSGRPQRAVYLDCANVQTLSWAPQDFDRSGGNLSLTRGFEAYQSSSATTWGGLSAQGITWASLGQSWSDLGGTSEQRSILVGSSAGTCYVFDSAATSDNGTVANCYWRSTGIVGGNPTEQKTVREWRVDYQADSASSLTLRFSSTGGASFGGDVQVDLPATSQLSQAIAYPYVAGRYPMFEIACEGVRPRLFRFYEQYRTGGR